MGKLGTYKEDEIAVLRAEPPSGSEADPQDEDENEEGENNPETLTDDDIDDIIEQAKENAARMGISGQWFAGPVEKILPEINWRSSSADSPTTIIVDPPREGLHPKAAQFLAKQEADQLVYVACNPKSLLRDKEVLEQGNWSLQQIWSVDLFPQTPHLELVGLFVRKEAPIFE